MSLICKDGGVLKLSFGVRFGRTELGTNSIHFFLFFVFRNVLCVYNYYSHSIYSLIPRNTILSTGNFSIRLLLIRYCQSRKLFQQNPTCSCLSVLHLFLSRVHVMTSRHSKWPSRKCRIIFFTFRLKFWCKQMFISAPNHTFWQLTHKIFILRFKKFRVIGSLKHTRAFKFHILNL